MFLRKQGSAAMGATHDRDGGPPSASLRFANAQVTALAAQMEARRKAAERAE
jgi:hypothetical protein